MRHQETTASDWGIWGFAFGYFACYVPYSALTKAIADGRLEKLDGPVQGLKLLPVSVAASVVGMFIFITLMRWWQYAGRRQLLGVSVPWPSRWTFLSGLCTAGVIGTTTLAYTFEGVSIVFMMLLMRGGVLILAPIVDRLSGRRTRWFSWIGLALSLGALVVAFVEKRSFALTMVAALDVTVYLAAYFIRLRFMSRLAKSDDTSARTRYFVEEQMIASPAILLALVVAAVIGAGDVMQAIRAGFTEIPEGPVFQEVILIGLFSQGTGIFGGLVLLDRRENTYCVPVNRCSSILAGVLASYSLHVIFDARMPSGHELVGAGMIVGAILVLTIPPMMEKRRASARR